MAEKKTISVWDVYDSMYNRGMKKGKGSFKNWADNPWMHPEKTRFSLGHLWHGKDSARHVGGPENLFSFKRLFGVEKKSGMTTGKLLDEILSKGKILHDYAKYNKSNPDEWKDSDSNLMNILEHSGKKYAKFVNKEDPKKISLYELTTAGSEWEETLANSRKNKENSESAMNLNEAFTKVKEQLLGGKKFKFGIKSDVYDVLSDKSARKAFNVKLSQEGERELVGKVQSHEKKKKGVKAGVAIAKDFADTLQDAWRRSYRG